MQDFQSKSTRKRLALGLACRGSFSAPQSPDLAAKRGKGKGGERRKAGKDKGKA